MDRRSSDGPLPESNEIEYRHRTTTAAATHAAFVAFALVGILAFEKKLARSAIVDGETTFQCSTIELDAKNGNGSSQCLAHRYLFAIERCHCTCSLFFVQEQNKCDTFALTRTTIFDNRHSTIENPSRSVHSSRCRSYLTTFPHSSKS